MTRFNLGTDKLHIDGIGLGIDAVVTVQVNADNDAIVVYRRRRDMAKVIYMTVEG
jgi:hypothetical protein